MNEWFGSEKALTMVGRLQLLMILICYFMGFFISLEDFSAGVTFIVIAFIVDSAIILLFGILVRKNAKHEVFSMVAFWLRIPGLNVFAAIALLYTEINSENP